MSHNDYGEIFSPGIDLEADVDYVLGINSADVGSACVSERVNKWALHKPVIEDTLAEISSMASKHGNYGLHLDAFSTADAAISGWEDQWLREPPTDYFRLTDFDGYNHYAEPQYYDCYRVLGLTNSARIGINWSGNLQSYEIPFKDIKPNDLSWKLSQCYFAVVMKVGSTTQRWVMCKQTPINPDGSGYQEEVTWDTGSYTSSTVLTPYPCLLYTTQPSRYATRQSSLLSADRIITLPISLDRIGEMAFKKSDTDSYGYMSVSIDNASVDRTGPRALLYGTLRTLVSSGSRPSGWKAKVSVEITDGAGHTARLMGLSLSESVPTITFAGQRMTGQALDSKTQYTATIRTQWGNGTTRTDTQTVMPH